MAYNEEKFRATIEVNSTQAKAQVEELRTKEAEYYKELMRLKQKDSGATKEQILQSEKKWKETKHAYEAEKKLVEGLGNAVKDLSKKNYKELQQEVKTLHAIMRDGTVKKGTDDWKNLAERIKLAKKEMREYTEATKEHQSIFSRFINFLNTNWGAFTQIIGTATGLTVTARKAVQAYAEMEEEMANVRKYTGMTDEKIRELNEDLKKMDTRTSREELNKLAGEAGRLGIQGKDAILEFVDAADKISVALGDDLGENAVRDIGKLAQTFGDADDMGLRGAMLSTGSAVNELAQSSSAAAGYIVDFTAKIAGSANQAGIAQTQVMGYASVLDQNMQHMETASTALSQLITKIYQDPAKFAKLAGQDIKEFTDLLSTDANAALLKFLEAMQQKGGFESLAPMFSEMGLSGTRAVGVLSTLATNLENIKVQQEIAAKAFKDGTSVLNEFDRMNDTVQAGIDKAKKAFHEIFVELGYNLQPVIKYTISTTGIIVNVLVALINVVKNCRVTLIAATVALAAWNAAAIKAMVIEKVTTALKACRAAFIALTTAMKINPWVALASVIATVGAAIIEFKNREREAAKTSDELSAAAQRQKNAQEKVGKASENLVGKYRSLQEQWKRLSSEHQKIQWIKKNQSAFSELNLTIISVHDAEMKLVRDSKKVIEALKATAEAAAFQTMLQESTEKLLNWQRTTNGKVKYKKVGNKTYEDLSEDELKAIMDDRKANAAKRAAKGLHIDERTLTQEEINKVTGMRIAAARKTYQQERKLLQDNIDYYADAMSKAAGKINAAEDKGTISTNSPGASGGKSQNNTTDDPIKKKEQELKTIYDRESLLRKQAYAQDVVDANLTNEEKKQAEEDYEQDMYELKQSYYTKVRNLYAKDSAEWVAWEDKRLSDQMNHDRKIAEEQQKAMEKANADAEKQMQEARKQYGDLMQEIAPVYGDDELEAQKLRLDAIQNMMKDFHDKGIISEEEYQTALDAIRAAHAEVQKEQTAQQIEKTREAVEFALQQVGNIISGVSSYVSACYQAEIAEVTARYDAEIDAAKKAGKDTTKLEKKKQKELNQIKLRQIEAETSMSIAEALVNTALGVTMALRQGGGIFGPILAGIVTAMGMLQLATIQKQAEAKKAALSNGYYEGGFTGGSNYHREAGVVHEGEFVANHQAVNNKNIAPVLSLIDQAQRSNKVASLKAEDVTNVMGGPAAQVVAPIVNIQTDNSELRSTMSLMNQTVRKLSDQIEDGIETNLSVQEYEKKRKHYLKLIGE